LRTHECLYRRLGPAPNLCRQGAGSAQQTHQPREIHEHELVAFRDSASPTARYRASCSRKDEALSRVRLTLVGINVHQEGQLGLLALERASRVEADLTFSTPDCLHVICAVGRLQSEVADRCRWESVVSGET
jgi:hypothetical protein